MRSSAKLPNLVLDAIGAGTWDWNIVTDTVVNSAVFADIVGIDQAIDERPRQVWTDLIHPDDLADVKQALNAALVHKTTYSQVYRLNRPDGNCIWIEDLGRVIETDDSGKATRMVGAIRDVTANMQTQRALQESEARLADITQNVPGAIMQYQTNRDGVSNCLYLSPSCAELFGVPLEEILADPMAIRDLFEERDRAAFWEQFIDPPGEPADFVRTVDFHTRSGQLRNAHIASRSARRADGSTVWTTVIMDVTHQSNLEREVAKSREIILHRQKIEAIGELSGGVAHDFNNLLSVIQGNLELIRDDPASDDTQEYVREAVAATQRGSELTRSLLSFARKASLKPSVLDLNQIVRSMNPIIQRTLHKSIDIEMSLMGGLWPVRADKSSAESALLNLVINARDAMSSGGKLTIETANIRLTDDYVSDRQETITPGRYVMIAVTDTGTGIEPELLDRVFEPFFTTKPVGHGTGLGLSSALGFTKQSGGTTRIYSEVGVGTSVKMFFRAEEGTARPPPNPVPTGAGNLERILLVEDETAVRKVFRQLLIREGYQVVEADSGDNGLEIFKAEQPFDLVLTDIVMPGSLMGTGMVKEIRKIQPDQRAIFISGYPNEAAIHGNGLRLDDIQLMKPVIRADLLAAIRQIIKGAD